MLVYIMGGGRNFERPNVERPIFRNLKVANERSSYSIFQFTKLFFHFFLNYSNTQIFFFFNFNALIFYNFPNLIFFGFLKFFVINKFCEFCRFLNLRKNFNYENLITFEIVEI